MLNQEGWDNGPKMSGVASILSAMTDDTATLATNWSARELADKIADNSPEEDSFVLRVLAARIAQRAEQCRDPLHLLNDLSLASASLARAVQAVVPRFADDELEKPESMATFRSVVDDLDGASAGLHDLQRWF
jgi:hypothetical protein